MNKKIYIGFDSKESKASEVCEFSLKKIQTHIWILSISKLMK